MRNLRIKYKISYSLILLLLCFGVISSAINYIREYRARVEDYKITGTSLIKILESHLATHLYVNDIVGAHRTLQEVLENNQDILYAFIINPDNKVIAHTFDQDFPSDLLNINNKPVEGIELLDLGDISVYDFSYPIVKGKVGIIRLGISTERMTASLRNSLLNILGLLIAFIGIGIGVSLYISKFITDPLDKLVNSTEEISKGDYKHTLEVKSNDEIGLLATAFNDMCNNLQNLTDRLEDKIVALNQKNNEYETLNEEYKTQNEALYKAKERAEESDRLKTAFLANLSHEIRTPMNGFLGFADLLRSNELTKSDQEEYIALIEQSGNRMLGLIKDLVDISKIEAKLVDVKNVQTNLNNVLDNLCEFFKYMVSSKGLTMECNKYFDDDQCLIMVDKDKLEGILTNLINNAMKFTDKGKISVGYKKVEDNLQFWVKDTGIGIPSDMKDLIFERFHQLDYNRMRRGEGSGLGLAICKAYIELMGGEIWVESELNKGSTFYFTIPYLN